MKKIIMIVILCGILLINGCSNKSKPNTTFRNSIWGDTISEVEKKENIPLFKISDNIVVGFDTVNDCENTHITFGFDDNGELFIGMYLFNLDYSAKSLYIDTYNNFKKILIKQYGKPNVDTVDENIKNNPYTTKWNIENLVINMNLTYNDKQGYKIGIIYEKPE